MRMTWLIWREKGGGEGGGGGLTGSEYVEGSPYKVYLNLTQSNTEVDDSLVAQSPSAVTDVSNRGTGVANSSYGQQGY